MVKSKKELAAEAAAEAEEQAKKLRAFKQKIRRRSRAKKTRALRSKAVEAGFLKTAIEGSGGTDQLQSLITTHDARRMVTFIPEQISEFGAFKEEEFEDRLATANEKISVGALEVLAPKLEGLFRGIVSEGMSRALDFGKTSIDATTMSSVLRPFTDKTYFNSADPPPGIVNFALQEGILQPTENDVAGDNDNKESNREMQRLADKSQRDRVAEREKRRNEKSSNKGKKAVK